MIYIVSTPIGNLGDITLRAIQTLKSVDLILAEDTRRTGILLQKCNIKTRMLSFNDNNKEKRTNELQQQLKTKNIALVSDAGTPGISDPGFYLVRHCVKNRIKVIPVPGASALLAALVCSGLPTDKFTFIGFLPKKEKKKDVLDNLPDHTVIAYESPYRILDTLELMSLIIPDRNIVIGRELTKKFEEFIRGKPKELYEKLKNRAIKGEIVLVISK
ncbi:16S rRNA (cytidine(1402)-2'-O)-methyltransferase [Candidatus Woesearchaeota archaeon]|nr:16S rRNA (cytidine(1402)-2'-O)-methyltransferase [Candidatus Woesearchaeota archaeon]